MQLQCSAFLFDLDGVLVDSREVVERTCRRWAARHQLDPEKVLRIAHGRRTRDTVKAAAPHLDLAREVAWLDSAELADVEGLREVPGVRQFLATLPAGSWAVVTSCGRELATLRLTSVGLRYPRSSSPARTCPRENRRPTDTSSARSVWVTMPQRASCSRTHHRASPQAGRRRRVIALSTTHPGADFTGAAAIIPDFTGLRVRRNRDAFVVTIE